MRNDRAITVKMPELMFAHVNRKAKITYRSKAEYIRQLIVNDMENNGRKTGAKTYTLPSTGETPGKVLRQPR